jgi:co-chaperonin GroES (HSP10)
MITPTGHKLLVLADPIEKETESGLVLVQDEKLEQTGIQQGLVIKVGPSAWKAFREINDGKEHNGPKWAVEGDYVLFARFAGRYVEDPFQDREDERRLMIMNDEDVIAIITEGENDIPPNPHREKAIRG